MGFELKFVSLPVIAIKDSFCRFNIFFFFSIIVDKNLLENLLLREIN